MFFGGNPFGGGGGPARQAVDNNKFYECLGVDKSANEAQIKKAYRKLAIVHHPDKGGDPEKFKEITLAYEVLSDPEKRRLYDEGGEEAVNNSESGGVSAEDIFASFFGGGMRSRGGPRGKRRGENVVYPLNVTLEDLYNGKTTRLRLSRKVICTDCAGKGGRADAVQSCGTCRGSGTRVVIQQIGPGMIQQMHTTCNDCQGEGEIIRERDRCQACKGKKVVPDKKTLEVVIEKGMQHGEKIVFSGDADEIPNTIPGDVIVVLQQTQHERFKRKGNDLVMVRNLSLLEALTSFQFTFQHLDTEKRYIKVASEPGHVYKQGEIKAIVGEGMPKHKRAFDRGNLYIQFNIEFPESGTIRPDQFAVLQSVLPGPTKTDDMDIDPDRDFVEEHTLQNVDPRREEANGDPRRRPEAYDDDDDDHQGGTRVGCQQQ